MGSLTSLRSSMMSSQVVCLFITILTQAFTVQPTSGACQNQVFRTLSQEGKEAILAKHNQLRRKVAKGEEANQPAAANMREMVWSSELEKIAQSWADNCDFKHNKNRGENIAWSSNSRIQDKTAVENEVLAMIQRFYDEVVKFNSKDINPFKFAKSTGHYTQLVWADTDEVGCGLVYYKDGGMNDVFLVCNYKVAGNVRTGEMYRVGEACSACQANQSCNDGLCGE